ncbi:hypothetical protein CFP65_0863 [Kitasatospora sp. MMS16-BH015]|uniref:hypothetical protein n=1 Tax=Kitasatospora sp. MMS16-BH015 TaxID=2018025 RepID=UPI000CA2452E|nr:hypothetical protein [Kitasatospora sp. MMS16-BH015]AUG75790.1 hypothetical protein CFP65_0863 [Kitasatospora sp. MMS16-BH015]
MTKPGAPMLRVRTSLPQRAVLTTVAAVLALLGLGGVLAGTAGAAVGGGSALLVAAVLALRSLRSGIEADLDGITSRTVERTQRLRWCEISSIQPGDARSASPVPATALVATTTAGRRLVLGGLVGPATRRNSVRLQLLRAELDRLAARHHRECATCSATPS